jgi:hypothetical protein
MSSQHTHTFTHMHARTHTVTHTHTHTQAHKQRRTHTLSHTHTQSPKRMHAHTHTHPPHTHIFTDTHACTHSHTNTHTQTHIRTHTHNIHRQLYCEQTYTLHTQNCTWRNVNPVLLLNHSKCRCDHIPISMSVVRASSGQLNRSGHKSLTLICPLIYTLGDVTHYDVTFHTHRVDHAHRAKL